MLTLGSLCDGIGGWLLAAKRNGVKPLWSAEIDKFCCSVTKRHFPDVIQLGDLTKIIDVPHVDIITAGTPCQNLSISGNRSGIHGEKSKIFFDTIKLVRRIRPQFFVWENVPGALSSNGGRDFQTVLEEIVGESIPLPRRWLNAGLVDFRGRQLAWRILDAQHFGVPQRRKRVFLVADFAGRRAAEILFEPASLRRNFAQGEGEERKTAGETRTAADCSIFSIQGNTIDRQLKNGARGKGFNADVCYTLNTVDRHAVAVTAFDITHPDEVVRPMRGDKCNTLNARMGTGGNQIPVVIGTAPPQSTVFGIGRDAFNSGKNARFTMSIERGLQPPITARGPAAVAANVIRRLTPLECERLQGLPADWTLGGSDTARYKALGNAMAQPVADFVIKLISEVTS